MPEGSERATQDGRAQREQRAEGAVAGGGREAAGSDEVAELHGAEAEDARGGERVHGQALLEQPAGQEDQHWQLQRERGVIAIHSLIY